jgi:DhnA family fructose-bisphosphate aldolase class Ia
MSLLAHNHKALILAMDHAITLGPVAGLEEPGDVIEAAIEAGAEAIMTSFGVVKKYRERLIGRIPTILRLDGGPSVYRQDWRAYTEYTLFHSVETALELGANGVVLNLFVGIPVELETYKIVARVAGACLKAELPLMVEALACAGGRISNPDSAEAMGIAARIAFEHGADLVKTYYSGVQAEFQKYVIANCPVPVLIAGGPKMDTIEAALQIVYEAMQAGAAGVVFGRNIWQSGNTPGMMAALRHIIHHNGSVSEAVNKFTAA